MNLHHRGLVAAYVLVVAGCVALRCDPWPAAQVSALRLPQASRVLQHLRRDALSAATALHGHIDSIQSSLSADMSPSSASRRQTFFAARVGAEADVQPGSGVLPDCFFVFCFLYNRVSAPLCPRVQSTTWSCPPVDSGADVRQPQWRR